MGSQRWATSLVLYYGWNEPGRETGVGQREGFARVGCSPQENAGDHERSDQRSSLELSIVLPGRPGHSEWLRCSGQLSHSAGRWHREFSGWPFEFFQRALWLPQAFFQGCAGLQGAPCVLLGWTSIISRISCGSRGSVPQEPTSTPLDGDLTCASRGHGKSAL